MIRISLESFIFNIQFTYDISLDIFCELIYNFTLHVTKEKKNMYKVDTTQQDVNFLTVNNDSPKCVFYYLLRYIYIFLNI